MFDNQPHLPAGPIRRGGLLALDDTDGGAL